MDAKTHHISLYLDTRRAKANGKYPVRLRVFSGNPRKQKLYPTTFEFKKADFESTWETVRPRNEYKDSRRILQTLILNAESIAEKLKPFTFEAFERKLFSGVDAGNDVFWHYDRAIESLKRKGQIGTESTYALSKKSIFDFILYEKGRAPKNLLFAEVTFNFLERYEKHMIKDLGRSRTTVSIYIRVLRTIFNNAIAEKEITDEIYPFGKRKYQIPAVKSVKKALDRNQLKQLFEAIPLKPEQARAKDFWFFSYSCNGMNIKDIAQLRYENIQDGQIVFYRAKTINTSKENLKPVTVYLSEFAKEVMNRYGNKNIGSKQLVFSIINDSMSDLQKHHKIKNFTRFINQNLKILAEANGISGDISTYWARHSFATNAIRNGATIEYVSEALSHSDPGTTKGYFAGFADETKKEFAEKLMNF